MREYNEVLNDHQTALREYAELAQNPESSQGAVATLAVRIKMLGHELSRVLSDGADVCKQCGEEPIGMLKTPGYMNNGVEVPPVFEVGCVYCPPFLQPNELRGVLLEVNGERKRMVRRSFSARANDPKEAVRKWNASEFVEDHLFERIPGHTPQYVNEET